MRRLLVTLAMLFGLESAAIASVARPAAPFLFTPMDERAAAFSSDGNVVVYVLRFGEYRQVLVVVRRHGGRWGQPEVPPFSGGAAIDASPSFSPDGRQLYFASNRNAAGGTKRDFDIWTVRRTRHGWGMPEPVRGDVNSAANETAPVLTRSGRLYFASSKTGNGDIYVADSSPRGFVNPQPIGAGVNSDYPEGYPAVSPDERTLVFMAAGRPDQPLAPGHPYARSDLYISRWTARRWGRARRLRAPINTTAGESSPSFSGDGRTLYFMSERGFATDQQVLLTARTLFRGLASPLNALGNIYSIDARALADRR